MGKVGSQTGAAISRRRSADLGRALGHPHPFPDPQPIGEGDAAAGSLPGCLPGNPTPRDLVASPVHLGRSDRRGRGDPGTGSKRWDVITLVRDPVARNVSLFFEKLEVPIGYDWFERRKQLSDGELLAELGPLFEEHVLDPGGLARLDVDPLHWFDLEMAPVFGVDIFATPFSPERGWQIYEGERARLLLDPDRRPRPGRAGGARGVPGRSRDQARIGERRRPSGACLDLRPVPREDSILPPSSSTRFTGRAW